VPSIPRSRLCPEDASEELAVIFRILLISQGFPKYPGDSTAPFMEAIVRHLVAKGNTVDVLLPHHPEFRHPQEPGFEFVQYRYSPSNRFAPWGFGGSLKGSSRVRAAAALSSPAVVLSLRRRVKRLLFTRDYDVVHAHWILPNAWAAAGPAAQRRVPLVITLHGSDVAVAERNALLRGFARQALRSAGAVTAVSDDLRHRAEHLGADPATTRTIHLGVDTAAFAPRDVAPSVRGQLGVPHGSLLVVAVGRLVEKKGFEYLIEAASRVQGVHIAIVGEGDLRGDLQSRARRSGASVSFAGNLERAAVGEAFAAADIVAVPSVVDSAGNVDGLPMTLLEALSTGCAVVASAVAGIPEVVADEVNGLLVPEKDVEALSGALTVLRDDPQLRHRLGNEARRRALAELDWNATVSEFEQAYAAAGAWRSP